MSQRPCIFCDNCNKRHCDDDLCIRQYKLTELFKRAQISEVQRKRITISIDKDATDQAEFTKLQHIEKNITKFVETGSNLYLHSSNCGNGKSTWANRLVQAYFTENWAYLDLSCHALFISVPSFLNALKRNITAYDEYAAYINKYVYDAELVVWDDIGSKVGSEYDLDQLFNILNRRIINGKANIYTSNLSTVELYNALGNRLASRIAQGSIDIELKGKDKRNIAAQAFWEGEL